MSPDMVKAIGQAAALIFAGLATMIVTIFKLVLPYVAARRNGGGGAAGECRAEHVISQHEREARKSEMDKIKLLADIAGVVRETVAAQERAEASDREWREESRRTSGIFARQMALLVRDVDTVKVRTNSVLEILEERSGSCPVAGTQEG